MRRIVALILACLLSLSFVACGGEKRKADETGTVTNYEEIAPTYDSSAFPFGPPPVFDPPVVVNPDDPFTGTWVDIYGDYVMQTLYCFMGDGRGYVDITDIRYYFEYFYDDNILTLREYPDTIDNYRDRVFEYEIRGNELVITYEVEDYKKAELCSCGMGESCEEVFYESDTWFKQ